MGEKETIDDLSPLEIIRQVLTDEQLHPEEFFGEISDGFVMEMADDLYHGAIAHLLEAGRQFVFYIDFRQKSTEQTHAQVTEFITRANRVIHIGNFELDYDDDGNVRFRSGLNYGGGKLSYNLVRNVIRGARECAEFWKPVLVQVLSGQVRVGFREGRIILEAL